MNFDIYIDTNIVSGIVTMLTRVSKGLYQSMIKSVPTMVMTPEKSEPIDCDIVWEMFSTSLVMRLMRSPC